MVTYGNCCAPCVISWKHEATGLTLGRRQRNEASLRSRDRGKCWPRRRRRPTDDSTQWITQTGSRTAISHMMVARIWAKHGLKPHWVDRYMASHDPDFSKPRPPMSFGLSLNAPVRAAVFCLTRSNSGLARSSGMCSREAVYIYDRPQAKTQALYPQVQRRE